VLSCALHTAPSQVKAGHTSKPQRGTINSNSAMFVLLAADENARGG